MPKKPLYKKTEPEPESWMYLAFGPVQAWYWCLSVPIDAKHVKYYKSHQRKPTEAWFLSLPALVKNLWLNEIYPKHIASDTVSNVAKINSKRWVSDCGSACRFGQGEGVQDVNLHCIQQELYAGFIGSPCSFNHIWCCHTAEGFADLCIFNRV